MYYKLLNRKFNLIYNIYFKTNHLNDKKTKKL